MPPMIPGLLPYPSLPIIPQNLPHLPIGPSLQKPTNGTLNFKHNLQTVPLFSGERTSALSVTTFVNEMEAAFRVNPNMWDEKTKIQACKSKLEGVARDLAYNTMNTKGSWKELKQDLLSLFSDNHIEKLTIQLRNTKKYQNEDDLKYYARIKTMAETIKEKDSSFNEDRECALMLIESTQGRLRDEILEKFETERLTSKKVMKFIQAKTTNKRIPFDSSYREQSYTEPATVSTCNTRPMNQSEFRDSYNHSESEPNYAPYCFPEPIHVAALNTKHNYQHSHRNKIPSHQEIEGAQYINDTKMPLPCTRCTEWGHSAYQCKGSGNNGPSSRKYAPVYCTNCSLWTWHGRNNRNCPTNQPSKDTRE